MVTQNKNVTLKAADKSLGRQKESTFPNTIRMNPEDFFFLLIFKLFGVLQSVVNVATYQKTKDKSQRR